jgi:hypothetical protein
MTETSSVGGRTRSRSPTVRPNRDNSNSHEEYSTKYLVESSCERHGSWGWHCRHSTLDTRTQSTDADTIGRHKGVRATSQSVNTLLLIHAIDNGRSGGRDFAQVRRSSGRLIRININCDESTYACRNSVEHEIETVTPSTRVERCDRTRRRRGITL